MSFASTATIPTSGSSGLSGDAEYVVRSLDIATFLSSLAVSSGAQHRDSSLTSVRIADKCQENSRTIFSFGHGHGRLRLRRRLGFRLRSIHDLRDSV
jgi:hypothetical protein